MFVHSCEFLPTLWLASACPPTRASYLTPLRRHIGLQHRLVTMPSTPRLPLLSSFTSLTNQSLTPIPLRSLYRLFSSTSAVIAVFNPPPRFVEPTLRQTLQLYKSFATAPELKGFGIRREGYGQHDAEDPRKRSLGVQMVCQRGPWGCSWFARYQARL